MRLKITRKQGWLLPCIFCQVLGLGFLTSGLATTSWIHFQCQRADYQMGVFQICSTVDSVSVNNTSIASGISSSNDVQASTVQSQNTWKCTRILVGSDRFVLPHWLRSTQILSLMTSLFAVMTCILTCLHICSKSAGNIAMGIAGLCLSSGALMIINVMSLSGYTHASHDLSFIDDITIQINGVSCPKKEIVTSYSVLLMGVSTCSTMMAGVWALLGSLFVSSGIGNITTGAPGYRRIDLSGYDFSNSGYFDSNTSSSSCSDDEENYDTVSKYSGSSKSSKGSRRKSKTKSKRNKSLRN